VAARRARGVDACRDHGLEFEVAVRERERPAVGSVGDLDVAGGDQAVGMLDLLGIAGELGGGVVGEVPLASPDPLIGSTSARHAVNGFVNDSDPTGCEKPSRWIKQASRLCPVSALLPLRRNRRTRDRLGANSYGGLPHRRCSLI